MTWYAASVLFAFDNVHGPQSRWHVWEDVVLIEASSHEEVMAKAQAYADTWTSLGTGLKMGGHLAARRFIGVRKVLTISNPAHMDIEQSDHPPVDGTEITFTEFIVESREDLEKLAKGERVRLVYEDSVRGRFEPDELVHLLGQQFPHVAALYKEHLESFGEVLAHVFFGDLTRFLLEQVTGADASDRREKVRVILEVLENAYAEGDDEMRDFLSASFLENLPKTGEAGQEIRTMLGPHLSQGLCAVDSKSARELNSDLR